ncbi:MAG: sigma-54-dependent Fis family transcriptional regulator [Candidatus Lambdaproteobacteria bacterium]|nr:sigma-54-dependent Fis family transcriptional regulator [Candidatus Lambdaproteobacteria bacterium]
MRILILDQNEVARRQVFWALRRGNDLAEASTRPEALALLAQTPHDLMLMELLEEQESDESAGMALVEALLAAPNPPLILIITRSERKEAAARLLRLGVLDVLNKPVDPEELAASVRRARRLLALRKSLGGADGVPGEGPLPRPGAQARAEDGPADLGLISVDERIKRMLEQIRRIGPTNVSVLITGEPGTGKESFAHAIHLSSDRRNHHFVPLNCAVLSGTALEDELYGHERGAFTGAIGRRKGKLDYAHRGTLFLEEVGEFALEAQPRFLRVLDEKRFHRLGGNQSIESDFRLVCAAHRDLEGLAAEGRFREDFLLRIRSTRFDIPPLRERRDDIKLLSQHFLNRYAREYGRPQTPTFSREAQKFMKNYPWPFNVRELSYFVERAVAVNEGKVIGLDALPENVRAPAPGTLLGPNGGNFEALVRRYKRKLVAEALQAAGNNKVKTAQLLGISKSYLFKLIKQLPISN